MYRICNLSTTQYTDELGSFMDISGELSNSDFI